MNADLQELREKGVLLVSCRARGQLTHRQDFVWPCLTCLPHLSGWYTDRRWNCLAAKERVLSGESNSPLDCTTWSSKVNVARYTHNGHE